MRMKARGAVQTLALGVYVLPRCVPYTQERVISFLTWLVKTAKRDYASDFLRGV